MTEGMPCVDHPALLAAMSRAARGQRPTAALRELLSGLVTALGARCGTLVAYQGNVGRVVAATPDADWSLGRRSDRAEPTVRRLGGAEVVDVDVVDGLPAELSDQLLARGLRRVAATGIRASGRVLGSLQVYFSDAGSALPVPAREALLASAGLAASVLAGTSEPTDRALASALADGLAVLGPDGLVRSWNPAAQLLTGVSASAAVGRPPPFPVPVAGRSAEHELADGRWVQVLCAALNGSDDRVVTFRDVTPAHRREQAKDLFVATASHELRTPVTVIRGYAETLDRRWDQLTEQQRRDAVAALRDRAERLAVLVDRLLMVDDDEQVGALLAPGEFELPAALRAAVGLLAPDEPPRLLLELPDRLPPARGDANSVQMVVSELVRNARKYSPAGGDITISVGADERTVYFRVADQGIGVQAEEPERAFDRLWQAEGTDRRRFDGVGLGLYLVRRIVEGQHGWVSLRRRNPDGTVAEVRLPRADVTSWEA